MNLRNCIVLSLFAIFVIAGCASTEITDREAIVTEKIPRPNQIWVYDFAATASDIPPDSVLAGQHSEHPTPQNAEQIEAGRKVGSEIAKQLVEQIRLMGMPAERASKGTTEQINDILIRGYLISVDEGSKAKRLTIGFGSGGSELKVAAEGFQKTAQGLRKLGSGVADAEGGKTPGAVVGLATLVATRNPVGLIVSSGVKVYGERSGSAKIEGRVEQIVEEIAQVLKGRFEEQGWIK
jgi:hypothetical protein